MFKSLLLLTLSSLVSVLTAHGKVNSHQVVYGEDDRIEVLDASDKFQLAARSVAAQFHQDVLHENGDGFKLNLQSTLGESFGLCSGERFEKQSIGAECSAFLVGKDILVTAGHCFDLASYDVCENGVWVFGYQVGQNFSHLSQIPKENVYRCKSIIKKEFTRNRDFAVIKLDREVVGRSSFKIDSKVKAKKGDKLVMLGFPSGLPMKVTPNAKVLEVQDNKYLTNLDAFHSNSGSVVLKQETMEVVGILVEGNPDYTTTSDPSWGNYCMEVNVCSEDALSCNEPKVGAGELVSKHTQFSSFLPKS